MKGFGTGSAGHRLILIIEAKDQTFEVNDGVQGSISLWSGLQSDSSLLENEVEPASELRERIL